MKEQRIFNRGTIIRMGASGVLAISGAVAATAGGLSHRHETQTIQQERQKETQEIDTSLPLPSQEALTAATSLVGNLKNGVIDAIDNNDIKKAQDLLGNTDTSEINQALVVLRQKQANEQAKVDKGLNYYPITDHEIRDSTLITAGVLAFGSGTLGMLAFPLDEWDTKRRKGKRTVSTESRI